jgi:uncharacterized protein YigE (DUF2233 family)
MARSDRLEQFKNGIVKNHKPLHSYFLLAFVTVILTTHVAVSNAPKAALSTPREAEVRTSPASPCDSTSASPVPLRCVDFNGHLYAVADVHLQSQRIIFTASDDHTMEAFPAVVSHLASEGLKPLLVTNAGIYGTDNRPLGLLISPKGKLHSVNTASGTGRGNFSWDSAVFQIADDDTASIVPARSWQDNPHTVAATQSGPQLVSSGRVNQSIPVQSMWAYSRTALGVDQSDRKLAHVTVSRDAVTLFELATFMASELHCSEALHLDGDLSAFYVPNAPDKFVFSNPGERIVTALSVVEKKSK